MARRTKAGIEESERIVLSERDSLLVLSLIENPPQPNAKLRAAIAALRYQSESGHSGGLGS